MSELKEEKLRYNSGLIYLYMNLRDLWALDAFPMMLYKDDERFSLIINNLRKKIKQLLVTFYHFKKMEIILIEMHIFIIRIILIMHQCPGVIMQVVLH